jgi:N-acetyl sugar amidotransferase
VLDTSVPDIQFDENGECQFCKQYDARIANELRYGPEGERRLKSIIEKIKVDGANKQYDCLLGVSGGADSTYVAYLAVRRFGLRPLAIHVDNGWNTDLAVENIQHTMSTLGIDLVTTVLDWNEFRDLQRSFLFAGIANAEIPTDHSIVATLFNEARSRKLRYIITGSNLVTEAVLPDSWMHDAYDLRLIKSVQRRFGTRKLRTFPTISYRRLFWMLAIEGYKFVNILNYEAYVKTEVKTTLANELGWRDYGGKHNESTFTKFFQGFILPRKFGIDKRRAHLANLVLAGQMTRVDALDELSRPYMNAAELDREKAYVAKKLGFTLAEFDAMMDGPVRSARSFPHGATMKERLGVLAQLAKRKATS